MTENNEIGIIQPIKGSIFIQMRLKELRIDFMYFSGHKIYGPNLVRSLEVGAL